MIARLVALALVLAAACGGSSRTPPREAQLTVAHADPRVGTYTSSVRGFVTSSYWIEGPDGIVLIDTQFLLSAAEEMIDWIERSTGKSIVLAIVLHPNPDKFNGTGVLRKRGIRVVTSEQVRRAIPAVHEKRLRAFYDRYKPDYPKEIVLPESFGDKDADLTGGGVTVRAHVLGAGCSESHVVVEWDGHLFPGDLVANDNHSWLELGDVDEWLKRIDEMRAMKPRFVHPGRGPSGETSLLDAEDAYLRFVRTAVADEKPAMPVRPDAIDRIKKRIVERYPYEYDIFLDFGLPAVWEKQVSLAGAAK
jgi:glyoxylase-like metal-dependent hydrolase (beta-lactamase superfamily II)